MTLSLGTAYRSFGGEMEASSTPMICRLPDSCRHQLSAIAPQRARLIVYGSGSEVIDYVKARVPDIRIMSGRTPLDYILWGWTGVMPEVCRGTAMLIPINFAPWLWGWPNKLLDRFEAVDTPV